MFVEGDINFSFDDDSQNISEQAYPLNLSQSSNSHNKYDWGFEYKIVPLVHNLSLKGNDSELQKHNTELYSDDINIFDTVTGKAFKDSGEHTGIVTYITYKDGGLTPKYIWILDNDDKKKYALYPKSCKVLNPKNTYQHKRINPFATNAMHLHEGRDIFSEKELQYDDIEEQKAYRLACIEKYKFNDEQVKAFDDLIMYRKYAAKYISIRVFDAYSFRHLLGIDSSDKKAVIKCIKLFIRHYCNLTDRYYDKNVKFWYNGGSLVEIKKWDSACDSNVLKVSSWRDIYMMTVAFMYTYNEFIHSYDYKPSHNSTKEEISFQPYVSGFKTRIKLFIYGTLSWEKEYWNDSESKFEIVFKK